MLGRRHSAGSARACPRRAALPVAIGCCAALTSAACAWPAAAAARAAPPVDNVLPAVEVRGSPFVGEASPGEELICGAGSWSGPVSEFEYEWVREGHPIASAAGVTYRVTSVDEGSSIWCIVKAIYRPSPTEKLVGEAESANSIAISGERREVPVNLSRPELTGRPQPGGALHCSTGSWSGNPTRFSYQWRRDGEVVESAAESEYRLTEADAGHELSCAVTAYNGVGASEPAASSEVAVAATLPELVAEPRVLGSNPATVGEILTCWPGIWQGSPAPTFSYRWLRDGSVIPFATGSLYTVEGADELHSLSCEVTATNSAGSSPVAESDNSVEVRGSKPKNTVPPQISGTPALGETLNCSAGSWSGVPAPTYRYLWIRDRGLAGEEAIGSATTSSYEVLGGDVGHALSCEVTATNSEGSGHAYSAAVVVPRNEHGSPPKNEIPPELSGTPSLGERLECSEGQWSGNPTPSLVLEWIRDRGQADEAIVDHSGSHVVSEADEGHSLTCEVTAFNDEGSATSYSDEVSVPGKAPENVETPEIVGTPAVGEALTCLKGRWRGAPPPTFTYRWLHDGIKITGAVASNYTITSDDEGTKITCSVAATNVAGTASATSSRVEVPGGPPRNIERPAIVGNPAVGETLTCVAGVWAGNPPPTFTYQWLLDGTQISSATEQTYTVVATDRGYDVSCEVTASNREGIEGTRSEPTHVPGIRPTPLPGQEPQVSGSPGVGEQLTCLPGKWSAAPPPRFTYQWLRDGSGIASATSATYTVELADQGEALSCVVTATNVEGFTSAESNRVEIPRATASAEVPTLTLGAGAPAPTAAQVIHALHVELARAEHHVRIATLRKAGTFTFPFAAPGAGRLEVLWWYQAPKHAHGSISKPLLLASAAASYASSSTKTVKLHLTRAGMDAFAHSMHIEITIKGLFAGPGDHAQTWLETVVLDH